MKSKSTGELSWVSTKRISYDKSAHSPGYRGLSCFLLRFSTATINEMGYEVVLVFIHLQSDELNQARIAQRISESGHIWTNLRAAMNKAFNDGIVDSNLAWVRIKPFKSVDGRRELYLTTQQANELLAASEGALHDLIRAGIQTGARLGELVDAQNSPAKPFITHCVISISAGRSNIPDDDYHSDTDTVSSTGLKKMLISAAHFQANLKREQKPTPALEIGRAVHALILERESYAARFAVAPVINRRTKVGKQEWADFQEANAGKTILSAADNLTAMQCAEGMMAHPLGWGSVHQWRG